MATLMKYNNGRSAMPSLFGWDPLRVFDDFFGPLQGEVVWSATHVNVKHEQDHALISVDMPGVDASDVELTYERGSLSIVGRREQRNYRYTVALGDDIDPDRIEADLDKGVLTIKAYKKPEAQPRKIALKGVDQKSLGSGESK
jgi:HSP20 family molecular chaperone IbpA